VVLLRTIQKYNLIEQIGNVFGKSFNIVYTSNDNFITAIHGAF
jgi:hypothetical protein